MNKTGILLISSIARSFTAIGQDTLPPQRFITVQHDNDYLHLLGKGTDRYYTAGNIIRYSFPDRVYALDRNEIKRGWRFFAQFMPALKFVGTNAILQGNTFHQWFGEKPDYYIDRREAVHTGLAAEGVQNSACAYLRLYQSDLADAHTPLNGSSAMKHSDSDRRIDQWVLGFIRQLVPDL